MAGHPLPEPQPSLLKPEPSKPTPLDKVEDPSEWKQVEAKKKYLPVATQQLDIYVSNLKPPRRIQIAVPERCTNLVVKKTALATLQLPWLPSEVILHKSFDDPKEDTPGVLQPDTVELYLTLIPSASQMLSYEVDQESEVKSSLVAHPHAAPSLDCKGIALFDTNVLIHQIRDERKRSSFFADGMFAGFTFTVKEELLHPSPGKELIELPALTGELGIQYWKTDEFLEDRETMMWNELYPATFAGYTAKSIGEPYPKKWTSWRDGEKGNAIKHLRNDVNIWVEAFVLARQTTKPIVLHTLDIDFCRMQKTKEKIRNALFTSFNQATIDLVTIRYHPPVGSPINIE